MEKIFIYDFLNKKRLKILNIEILSTLSFFFIFTNIYSKLTGVSVCDWFYFPFSTLATPKSTISPHASKAVKPLRTLQEEQQQRERKPLLQQDTEEVSIVNLP